MPETLLILGGSGFVGRHLCAGLIRAGYGARVLTRNRERNKALLVLPGLELVEADVHDPLTLAAQTRGASAVINLIGILNERGHRGAGFRAAHVELVRKLIAACRSTGVNRLVQVSALGAARDGPSHYLRTKGEAEQLIRSSPLAWTILQPSVIFGPDDSFLNRFAMLLRRLPVMPLAQADARLSPVWVEDVRDAILATLATPRAVGQTYQLCGPEVMTLADTVRYVRDLLRLRRAVLPLPTALGRAQAQVLEFVPGKPLSVDNFRSLTVPSVCQENGFARLGITPRSVRALAPAYFAAR
jgi:uncharacterized protein YbjT (DUF2867 family)